MTVTLSYSYETLERCDNIKYPHCIPMVLVICRYNWKISHKLKKNHSKILISNNFGKSQLTTLPLTLLECVFKNTNSSSDGGCSKHNIYLLLSSDAAAAITAGATWVHFTYLNTTYASKTSFNSKRQRHSLESSSATLFDDGVDNQQHCACCQTCFAGMCSYIPITVHGSFKKFLHQEEKPSYSLGYRSTTRGWATSVFTDSLGFSFKVILPLPLNKLTMPITEWVFFSLLILS